MPIYIKPGKDKKVRTKLPEFLKRPIIDTDTTRNVRRILKQNCLNTVCENARCPNKNECYTKNTATFLIMGNVCTRNCKYCNILCQKAKPLDKDEPVHVANAVKALGLKYAVITSVTRDDLPDGGAGHFAQCIYEIRKIMPEVKIEILTPDFKNDKSALDIIIQLSRLRDKSRRTLEITEVVGYENGEIQLNPLYRFVEHGEDENGRIIGGLERTDRPLINKYKFQMAGLPDTV